MQTSFPITTYNDSHGDPLNQGYLLIRLNKDTLSPNGQICAGQTVKILLDSSGVIQGSPVFWQNSDLNPNDSSYVLKVFSNEGLQIGKTQKVII